MASNTIHIPENWAWALLEDVCEILDAMRIPVNNSERGKRTAGKPGKRLYPYYGATGQVGVIDGYIFDGEHVLLGEDGAPFLDPFKEKAYIANGQYWVNNHAHILRAAVSNKYLKHFLNHIDYSEHVTGTTRLKLNQSALRGISVQFAPEAEQHRIVAKIEELFSELDDGVESLKTAREQLKVYRQAVLKNAFEGKLTAKWREENRDKLETADQLLVRIGKERDSKYRSDLEHWKASAHGWNEEGQKGPKPRKPEAFKQPRELASGEASLLPTIPDHWRYVRLSEVAKVGSGMSVSAAREIEQPVEVAYLRVANVQRGFLDLSEIKSMTVEKSQLASLRLKRWDVLFNEGGDRDKLGRGWIWRCEVEPCITQNHVFRASLYIPSETSAKLISHWGNTFGQQYFEQTGKQTTNLASINKTVLSEFPVPLIPPAEQEAIRNHIDRVTTVIDAHEEDISEALERAEILRQAILKAAFAGQLVAQHPNDEPASALLARIKAEKSGHVNGAKKNKRKEAA